MLNIKSKKTILALGVFALLVALTGVSVYAQGNGRGPEERGKNGDRPMPPQSQGKFGTSTKNMPPRGQDDKRPTTTNREMGKDNGDIKNNGFIGVITDIDSSSFAMDSRSQGNATTTFTINVSSETKFYSGSTTIAYSDLVTGNYVAVAGSLATSTKTITANRVNVLTGDMRGFSNFAPANSHGLFSRIGSWVKNFFGGKK
jgi:hypothetical protein